MVSWVIWQRATSPTCHPLWPWMDSSNVDFHLMRWCLNQPSKRHLYRLTPFAQLTRLPNTQIQTQTDTQTTLRVTSVAVGRMLCMAYRRCSLIISGICRMMQKRAVGHYESKRRDIFYKLQQLHIQGVVGLMVMGSLWIYHPSLVVKRFRNFVNIWRRYWRQRGGK